MVWIRNYFKYQARQWRQLAVHAGARKSCSAFKTSEMWDHLQKYALKKFKDRGDAREELHFDEVIIPDELVDNAGLVDQEEQWSEGDSYSDANPGGNEISDDSGRASYDSESEDRNPGFRTGVRNLKCADEDGDPDPAIDNEDSDDSMYTSE